MNKIKVAIASPSGTFKQYDLTKACAHATKFGLDIIKTTKVRKHSPSFINGAKGGRLQELIMCDRLDIDAIWCARGGVGSIELLEDYVGELYKDAKPVLIGYSDITVLHLLRFLRASRIGIHGPVFLDLLKIKPWAINIINLMLKKRAQEITYPPLKPLSLPNNSIVTGAILPMNLTSLQTLIGCFDHRFFSDKILALEEVNEKHYQVHRLIHHLKNAGLLRGLKGLVLGQMTPERQEILQETMIPLARDLSIPLFDWPIFGHEQPNWPLLFGAQAQIFSTDNNDFALRYLEQIDHSAIAYEPE